MFRSDQNGGESQNDRRGKRRFHIQQPIRYKLLYGPRLAETGSGQSINISSSGLCFSTERVLPVGLPVEVSMNWPALLNDVCPMKLMIFGCVLRSDDRYTTVTIERYEFRTQGTRGLELQTKPQPLIQPHFR